MSHKQTMRLKACLTPLLRAALISFATIGTAPAWANAIVAPAGLAPGATFQLIFVTDQSYQATDPNLDYYNTAVQNDADDAGLGTYNGSPVIWQVVGETASSPGFPPLLPNSSTSPALYNLNGVLVAAAGQDPYTTTLLSAPDIDQNGNVRSTFVWTGIIPSVSCVFSSSCLGQSAPSYGVNSDINIDWFTDFGYVNMYSFSLYAVSQTLTVPGAATPAPEPASTTALGVGLAGLWVVRRRRKAALNQRSRVVTA